MANPLMKLVADRKNLIEEAMEVFQQGAEIAASVAGDVFPFFEIAAPLLKLALDNVESKEAKFITEQFQRVRNRLRDISEEVEQINEEIVKNNADIAYSIVEENLTNQFRKYMDILNDEPQYRECNKEEFMGHFEQTGGDDNLHSLYKAVTGDNFFRESVLGIKLKYEHKNRRVVENFCARLKNLFCVGLIALIGYHALKCKEEEEGVLIKLMGEWRGKMEIVQSKMTAAIEDCIISFPTMAWKDARTKVHTYNGKSNMELANVLLETLKKKFDWVRWSVRVFSTPSTLKPFSNKKELQCFKCRSHFSFVRDKLNVMVSYSDSPRPLNKAQIRQLVDSHKSDIASLDEVLFENVPACVVHTIDSSCKDVVCSHNFPEELHYWEEKPYVCVHSA